MVGNYKVITLCGSTRFKDEFMEQQRRLTLEGNIVLSVCVFTNKWVETQEIEASGGHYVYDNSIRVLTDKEISMLDDIHKRKIDMSDEIFVINPGGYIGESTASEIEYAKNTKKIVRYLVHPLEGKKIKFRREGTIHEVTKVHIFVEDTFHQGDFAVETKDGKYLYECEIEVVDDEKQ